VVDVPAGLVQFAESRSIATKLSGVGVPLSVVLDRQSDIRQRKIDPGHDLAVSHNPMLGDHRHPGEMEMHAKHGFRRRLGPFYAKIDPPEPRNVVLWIAHGELRGGGIPTARSGGGSLAGDEEDHLLAGIYRVIGEAFVVTAEEGAVDRRLDAMPPGRAEHEGQQLPV
jgi:hypothetical protein